MTCFTLALEDAQTANQTIQVGGEEFLTFAEVLQIILRKIKLRRIIVDVPSAYLRILGLWVEQFNPDFPFSLFWLDYLAADRTCSIDTVPRMFGLIPARFNQNLDYLLKV